jgi:hypothetical protein
MDAFEIIFVVVPIVAPPLLTMPGVDPVWLGIMMAVNLQTSYMHPPLGPTYSSWRWRPRDLRSTFTSGSSRLLINAWSLSVADRVLMPPLYGGLRAGRENHAPSWCAQTRDRFKLRLGKARIWVHRCIHRAERGRRRGRAVRYEPPVTTSPIWVGGYRHRRGSACACRVLANGAAVALVARRADRPESADRGAGGRP